MRIYLEALRVRYVAHLLFSQLLARFPAGMLSIALLIHVEQTYGDYTAAGFTIAAFAVGQGIAGPLGGRLLARFGMRRLLVTTLAICATSLTMLGLTTPPMSVLLPIAFVTGLTVPPVPSAVRTLYPKVAAGPQLKSVFAIDATLQEIIWILGPLLTTAIAATFCPRVGIVLCAVVLLVGGAWFVSAPPVGQVKIPRSPRPLGAVLREPVVAIMTLVCTFAIGSWGALDTAAIARFGHDNPFVGAVLGLSAVGSLIGGLVAGLLGMPKWSMAARVAVAATGAVVALFMVDQPFGLVAAYFVAGMAAAPVIALANTAVSAAVRFSDTAEAFGWLATAQLVGSAASSALAGIAIDQFGAVGGLIVGAGFTVIALIIAIVAIPWLPDLRTGEISPRPDTVPIVLPNSGPQPMPKPTRDCIP